jgi:hypothetical protein
MIALSIAAILWGAAVWRFFALRRPAAAALAIGGGMIACMAVLVGAYLPAADFLQLSRRTGEAMIAQGATAPGRCLMIDYKEPAVAFYQGGTIREERDNEYFNHTDPAQWKEWFVITGKVWARIAPERQARLEIVWRRKGLAYADKGRIVEVMIVRKRP